MVDVGIHPNFRPNSSHGSCIKNVCESLLNLFPNSIISRSHGFIDSPEIQSELFSRGIKYDSNQLSQNKPHIKIQNLSSGITRIPCFWSDGMIIHNSKDSSYNIQDVMKHTKSSILKPGYKILNVHPILFVTNSNNYKHYKAIRKKTTSFCKEDLNHYLNTSEYGVKDYFYDLFKVPSISLEKIQEFTDIFN